MIRGHATPMARACGWLAAAGLFAATGPATARGRIVNGPYLTGLSPTGVDVRFELDGSTTALVEIVRDDDAGADVRVFDSRSASAMRVVRATGLERGTTYAYRVRVDGAVVGVGHFKTAPADNAAAALTFLVYGDDRTDPTAHAAVVRAMQQVPSDFLVNTGDLVDNGASAQDWQSFFDIEAPLLRERPLFVSIGNHELRDDLAGANFARYSGFLDESGINRPYGTTRLGNTRFFFLNGMHDWRAGDEREWLERALERSDAEGNLVWRIAVVHHGPWSLGPHGANARLIAAGVPALLAAHKVDLLLSGHDHIYQRGDAGPLKYIVSGGGGAPLYGIEGTDPTERRAESTHHFVAVAVTEERIRTLAMRVDGTTIESCGFVSRGAWECSPDISVAAHSAASPARPAPSRSTSHCGCAVPGAGRIDAVAALAAFALVGVIVRDRRRVGRRGLSDCRRRLLPDAFAIHLRVVTPSRTPSSGSATRR